MQKGQGDTLPETEDTLLRKLDLREAKLATQVVHAGERETRLEPTPTVAPIYPSVTYSYDSASELDQVFGDEKAGFNYRRYGNPTTRAFEMSIALLEEAEDAVAFSTGMAAVHAAVLACGLQAGDRVVSSGHVYGASYVLLDKLLASFGCPVTFVNACELDEVESALEEHKPRLLLFETLSNPLMLVADLPRLVEMAHRHEAKVVVDNTFLTPYLLKPTQYGADFVVHSATKYISGHGDVMAGVVASTRQNCALLSDLGKLVGGNLSPWDAWLAQRGLKTLALRMQRQCQNAAAVAAFLEQHPKVEKVHYPGLAGHPQHKLAGELFGRNGYGGMLSFELHHGSQQKVFRVLDALRLCVPATTLGDVYTLLLYPAMSSHRKLTPEQRQAVGIGEGLVRVSVGIEDVEDICADLDQALMQA